MPNAPLRFCPASEVSDLTGVTINRIEHLVNKGVIEPVVEASRRGSARRFDDEDIAQISIASRLLDCGVSSSDVIEVLCQLRQRHNWSRLIPLVGCRLYLVVWRLFGRPNSKVHAELLPSDGLKRIGTIANQGKTIIAGFQIRHVVEQ
jgi:DNA-binding transcriptional MerR regulator